MSWGANSDAVYPLSTYGEIWTGTLRADNISGSSISATTFNTLGTGGWTDVKGSSSAYAPSVSGSNVLGAYVSGSTLVTGNRVQISAVQGVLDSFTGSMRKGEIVIFTGSAGTTCLLYTKLASGSTNAIWTFTGAYAGVSAT